MAGHDESKKAAAKHSDQAQNHYIDKIDRTPGRPAGTSRDWGAAPSDVKQALEDALLRAAKTHGLTEHEAAAICAGVYNESGFNPDAAIKNKKYSAAGPGQFNDATRETYHITNKDIFDIPHNADAIVQLYIDSEKVAMEHHRGATGAERDKWTYKYYHDGLKSNDRSGRGLEEFDKPNGVKEWIPRYEESIGPSYDSPRPAPPAAPTSTQPAAPSPSDPMPQRQKRSGLSDDPFAGLDESYLRTNQTPAYSGVKNALGPSPFDNPIYGRASTMGQTPGLNEPSLIPGSNPGNYPPPAPFPSSPRPRNPLGDWPSQGPYGLAPSVASPPPGYPPGTPNENRFFPGPGYGPAASPSRPRARNAFEEEPSPLVALYYGQPVWARQAPAQLAPYSDAGYSPPAPFPSRFRARNLLGTWPEGPYK